MASVLVGLSGWIGEYMEEPARYVLYCATGLLGVVAVTTIQQQQHSTKIATDDLVLEPLATPTQCDDEIAVEKACIRAAAASVTREATTTASLACVSTNPSNVVERGIILTSLVDQPVGSIRILVGPNGASGGRLAKNEIILEDSVVSRVHFQLRQHHASTDGGDSTFFYLQDCGSTTGTFLYLAPWEKRRLHVHDAVKVGDAEFVVVALQEDHWANTKPFLRIKFTTGPMAGVTQRIGLSPVTIGRRTTCALCLEADVTVSGQHCTLEYLESSASVVEAGYYITDLNSTNGTGMRLSATGVKSMKVRLQHKDVFGVGATKFLVEYPAMLAEEKMAKKAEEAAVHGSGQSPVRIA
ncbi:hypothetical protein DYB32_000572 [Aphanomyces invadans]|nr:hypothetical protein DYB32_000572 [Aphanomyces invadans]